VQPPSCADIIAAGNQPAQLGEVCSPATCIRLVLCAWTLDGAGSLAHRMQCGLHQSQRVSFRCRTAELIGHAFIHDLLSSEALACSAPAQKADHSSGRRVAAQTLLTFGLDAELSIANM
jgi:hypothetical protein